MVEIFENLIQLIIWSFFLSPWNQTFQDNNVLFTCWMRHLWCLNFYHMLKVWCTPHTCKHNAKTGCISLRPVLASCSKRSKSELVGCLWSPFISSGSMIISPGRSLRIPKALIWFLLSAIKPEKITPMRKTFEARMKRTISRSSSTPWIELKIRSWPAKIDQI